MLLILTIISSVAFIVYGFLCVFTQHMHEEFKRYGFLRFKLLVGILEILGGLGLLVGHFYSDSIYLLSSLGLSVLMLMGIYTRLKIKDPILQILPAMILLLINALISYQLFEIISF